MSLEDEAFNNILYSLENNENFHILSAHPPSGKSYTTDLIRIPSPEQNKTGSRRAHIDIIFCSKDRLYLCEVKGKSEESTADIIKLKSLTSYYSLPKLKKIISNRLTSVSSFLETINQVVISIGCTSCSFPEENILYLIASNTTVFHIQGFITPAIKNDFRTF